MHTVDCRARTHEQRDDTRAEVARNFRQDDRELPAVRNCNEFRGTERKRGEDRQGYKVILAGDRLEFSSFTNC